MTAPVPVTPSKAKTWFAVVGGVLATLIPIILGVLDYVPAQYAWIASAVHAMIALLTALGVYHAPYKPAGTVLVVPPEDVSPSDPAGGPYGNPWPKP